MKTLSIQELDVLTSFNYARANWNAEDTRVVRIDYDAEYQDFAVVTAEKNVRKNRISKLQAEITAWAENQLSLFGYANLVVSVFHLSFEDGAFGLDLVFADADPNPVEDETLAD